MHWTSVALSIQNPSPHLVIAPLFPTGTELFPHSFSHSSGNEEHGILSEFKFLSMGPSFSKTQWVSKFQSFLLPLPFLVTRSSSFFLHTSFVFPFYFHYQHLDFCISSATRLVLIKPCSQTLIAYVNQMSNKTPSSNWQSKKEMFWHTPNQKTKGICQAWLDLGI